MKSIAILAFLIIDKLYNVDKWMMNPENSTIQGERFAVNLAFSVMEAHCKSRDDFDLDATIDELYLHELNALRRSHTDSNPEFFESKCNTLTNIRIKLMALA